VNTKKLSFARRSCGTQSACWSVPVVEERRIEPYPSHVNGFSSVTPSEPIGIRVVGDNRIGMVDTMSRELQQRGAPLSRDIPTRDPNSSYSSAGLYKPRRYIDQLATHARLELQQRGALSNRDIRHAATVLD
jgi:hypothetical protein